MNNQQQLQFLANIALAAEQCRKVEERFGRTPSPELQAVIGAHRVVALSLAVKAKDHPDLMELACEATRMALGLAALEERRATRELAQKKHEELTQERKEAREAEQGKAKPGVITEETMERIERELNLL
jgi:hypothetical protein